MSSRKHSKQSKQNSSQKTCVSQSRSLKRKSEHSPSAVLETGAAALLPAHLREATDERVDEFIDQELDRFDLAIGFSDAGNDPIRRMLARVSLRMALDPRIHEKQVRARTQAILNTSKTLGLDRDLVRANTNERHVETVLSRIRDAAHKGVQAAGRKFEARNGEPPSTMSSGQEILHGGPLESGERAITVGPIRTTLSDTGENSGQDRFGQGRGPSIEIDCAEESSS